MFWANFLHIYQPANQMPDILKRVVNESYRPILATLKKNPQAKITLNINAVLTELFFKHGYFDILNDLKLLGSNGQIEFTSSAKYHAFLPLLPVKQIERQIILNHKTNQKYLGKIYKPQGFFPPEMGYSFKVAKVVQQLGYQWMLIDEIAHTGKTDQLNYQNLYELKQLKNFKIFFRERRTSNLIMSAMIRNGSDLAEYFTRSLTPTKYLVTAMDGETFGHHRPGLDKLLEEIFSNPTFNLVTISQLTKLIGGRETTAPINSTWASSEKDIENNIQFISWHDPKNIIHSWQWQAVRHLLNLAAKYKIYQSGSLTLKEKIDSSLASDQFWWASAKPWWSLEMIEEGAHRIVQAVCSISRATQVEKNKAHSLYQKIVLKAFEWQRTGLIRRLATERDANPKLPFITRTLEQNQPEVYHAFIDTMRSKMLEATNRNNFERAILWRDAIHKIESKNDIYDAVHACDLLRQEMKWGELEKIMDSYKLKYKTIRGGQPEQR